MTRPNAHGELYAEAFVAGRNIKAWFWNGEPVHTQCELYACITGNGRQATRELVAQRLEGIGEDWKNYKERDAVLTSLAYQDVAWDEVLPRGRSVWLDYRYGRRFSQAGTTEAQDNAWSRLHAAERAQIVEAGQWLARAIKPEVTAPVLCSMDGVLDDQGKIWWLELNSNPICPPNAYFAMMTSLFGTPTKAPANAYARVVATPRRGTAPEDLPAVATQIVEVGA